MGPHGLGGCWGLVQDQPFLWDKPGDPSGTPEEETLAPQWSCWPQGLRGSETPHSPVAALGASPHTACTASLPGARWGRPSHAPSTLRWGCRGSAGAAAPGLTLQDPAPLRVWPGWGCPALRLGQGVLGQWSQFPGTGWALGGMGSSPPAAGWRGAPATPQPPGWGAALCPQRRCFAIFAETGNTCCLSGTYVRDCHVMCPKPAPVSAAHVCVSHVQPHSQSPQATWSSLAELGCHGSGSLSALHPPAPQRWLHCGGALAEQWEARGEPCPPALGSWVPAP